MASLKSLSMRVRGSLLLLAAITLGAACGGGNKGPVDPVIGPPTNTTVDAGNSQSALAGTALAAPVTVRVRDANGNAVPNVAVTLQVTGGDGTISTTTATTDATGAITFTWTLGKSVEPQTVTISGPGFFGAVSATVTTSFALDLRFYGTAPTPTAQLAFQAAVNRIRAANVGQLTSVQFTNTNARPCIPGDLGPPDPINEVVTGVIIFANVTPIDGPGKILASAGPCFIRQANQLTALGVMRFDADDIDNLVTTQRLNSVVLHEMLHVIGIGTLWEAKSLLLGKGTPDPRFTGPLAISACTESGGAQTCATGVPVENMGGPGTRDGHWRESIFDSELMTGFVEAPSIPNPFSKMSIQSLGDLGYGVNPAAADPYTIPFPLNAFRVDGGADPQPATWESVVKPLYEISSSGKVTPARKN